MYRRADSGLSRLYIGKFHVRNNGTSIVRSLARVTWETASDDYTIKDGEESSAVGSKTNISRAVIAGYYGDNVCVSLFRNKLRIRAGEYSTQRCAASINYTTMRGHVCYRRLEKSSALDRYSSANSNTDDATLSLIDETPALPATRATGVIGSTDIRLFYEIGGATDEFIALILDTMLPSRARALCPSSLRSSSFTAREIDRRGMDHATGAPFIVKHLISTRIKMQMRAFTIMNVVCEDTSERFRPLPRPLFKAGWLAATFGSHSD